EKGNKVSFLTYYEAPFFNPILEKSGISINCVNEPKYLKRLIKMRRFIRRGNYDAILSFLEGANFICEFARLSNRKWKLVVGERNADPNIHRSLKLKLYRWFHVFADYIVSNSNANIQIVRSVNPLISKEKCKVIYNAINFSQWEPLPDYKYRRNEKLNLVVAAGHSYRKNLNGLVEALALLRKDELEKIDINWFGDYLTEPYHDGSFLEAKQKINILKLEKVISFYPATNEITKKIQNADAIGLFSFIEGLPNIVCEGMACAKPVICSEVSDVPELLSLNKNLLCNPSDPKSIKNAISYLLSLSNDQLSKIGLENQKVAKKLFNKERIISAYLKLLTT
ncbi:MAG TPA: glycosyltransferase family 4 protein, partial [Ignavibacteria bacterium]